MKERRRRSSAGLCFVLSRIESIHHLDRRRLVRENGGRGLERLQQIGELNRQDGFRFRQRDEVDPRFDDDAQRALRPHHQLRHVEWLAGPDEGVEIVAADAAQNLGVSPLDFSRRRGRDPPDLPVTGGLE